MDRMSSIDSLSAVIGRQPATMHIQLLRAIVAGALGITVVGRVAALRGTAVGEQLVALSAVMWGTAVGELVGTMTADVRGTGAVGLWERSAVGLLGWSILGRVPVPIRNRGRRCRCWMRGCCLRRCVVGGQRLSR